MLLSTKHAKTPVRDPEAFLARYLLQTSLGLRFD